MSYEEARHSKSMVSIVSKLMLNCLPMIKRIIQSRFFRRSLAATLVLLLVALVVAWIVGGRLVAPANRVVQVPEDLAIEAFEIDSESGSTIAGWCLTNQSADSVVILLHPVRANRTAMLSRAKLFFESGFSVVMIDLQAHGESPGENITFGHLEKHDVRAAVNFAKEKFSGNKIGIVGWSLGGAAALLASPLDVDAMVLESVYPTVSHAVYDRVDMRLGGLKYVAAPLLLGQLKMRLGISTGDLRPIDFMDKVGCPVLILAGDKDLHTPMDESQMMIDAAKEPKELLTFVGAGHQDLYAFDQQQYREKVVEFLRVNLGADSTR